MTSKVSLCVVYTLAVLLCSHFSLVYTKDTLCPAWFVRDTNGSCKCGDSLKGKVRCDGDQVSLLLTYCMTYSSLHNTTVVGACPFFLLRMLATALFPYEVTYLSNVQAFIEKVNYVEDVSMVLHRGFCHIIVNVLLVRTVLRTSVLLSLSWSLFFQHCYS